MGRLADAWRLLNLPCRGMSRLASESLDRDLGRLERVALRTHTAYCTPCRRYLRQLRQLRRLVRRFADPTEPAHPAGGPGLAEDVRARIKESLRRAGPPGPS